jgi:nitrogen fixation/metabolism regulation signal transduction histidine kinase
MNIKLDNIFSVVFVVFTLVAILIAIFWMISTEKRLKRFFSGKKARDLEDTIVDMEKEILNLKKEKDNIKTELQTINSKLRKSIRGLETIRFNPFPDQGSNQSFAISMLNEDGDGVVMSSLYSRDRMSIFAKPVKNKKSEYELTEEEKEVLAKSEVK